MTRVVNHARPQEDYIDDLIHRFNKLVQRAGVLSELKKRVYYEKPSLIRHRKKLEKVKKARRTK